MSALSPMMVQYLTALCCLKVNPEAIDIIVGDMVFDAASEKKRDVDVTVKFVSNENNIATLHAFEVKHESKPLDVAVIGELCNKLGDMPSVKYKAIVSSSGYTDGAINKASYHKVDLYKFCEWNEPMEKLFPLWGFRGAPQQCFPTSQLFLQWVDANFYFTIDSPMQDFSLFEETLLFDAKGKEHKKFKTYGDYYRIIHLRSTSTLACIEPAKSVFLTFPVPFFLSDGTVPKGPAWPHTHTLDLTGDSVYIKHNSELVRVNQVSISGQMQWERSGKQAQYYVIENVINKAPLSSAIVMTEDIEDKLTALVFSPETASFDVRFIHLLDKHKNVIRKLKIT